jgi:hypothetical protein
MSSTTLGVGCLELEGLGGLPGEVGIIAAEVAE